MKVMRLFFLCFLSVFISCNKSVSNKEKLRELDTIIDFTKVDVYPSFADCKELMDEEKTICFRNNIHKKITHSLKFYSFNKVKDSISEELEIVLKIEKDGKICLENIKISDDLNNKIPDFYDFIYKSIDSLPNVFPAIKRGIPVNTQYKLPIKIHIK